MSKGRNIKVFDSFQELKKTGNPNVNPNPGSNQNNRETCPGCGNRTRRADLDHPLCFRCNGQFIEETAKLAVAEEGVPLNRLQWAKEKGEATLQRLRAEHKAAQEEERQAQQPYWNQAHAAVNAKLEAKGIGRIDPKAFNKAKGLEFGKFWNVDPKHVALSKKVYGLKKAIESLETLLQQLEEKLSSGKESSEEGEE